MQDAEDPPTHRDSGSLSVFENTAAEALTTLEEFSLDEEGHELMHEARELATIFAAWRSLPPSPEDRTVAITRVMTLHRSVGEYVVRRRARLTHQ
jgi:hypothetical protein